MSIDTLTLARELRAADFAAPQAEAIAAAIGRAVVETSATKADLGQAVGGLKADLARAVAGLEAKIATLDAKVDQQGAHLSADIRLMGSELKSGLAGVESTLMKWFIGAVLALGGLMVALTKL